MRQKTMAVLGTTACLILICASFAFSQEAPGTALDDLGMISDVRWLWGEASSIDTQKDEIFIRYIDYETEEEKEMTITVDENTSYENIESLSKIKPQDTLSIEYIVSPEGKNLAKNISFEKADSLGGQGMEELSIEDLPEYPEPSDTAQE